MAEMSSAIDMPVQDSGLSQEFSVTWIRSFRVPLRLVSQFKAGDGNMGRGTYSGRLDDKIGFVFIIMIV